MPARKQEFVLPNGDTIELFYIGALAYALGRTPDTIRKWEIGGVIPDPLFQDANGRRLYSQEQIDAIVKCAERAKIRQGASIANTSFSQWCHKELKAIREKYIGGLDSGEDSKSEE